MKKFKIPLIFLFSLGLGLRFFCLGEKSVWLDEACGFYQAGKSIPFLIKEAFTYDLHPPLYSILLHYWIKAGEGEFILRSLSALFGFLSLIAFYKLARLILNREGALTALVFFTVSALAIFFSQEARPYSLFLLEAIFLSYLLLKGISSRSKTCLLFYILTGIMAIYTHLYTALIFLTHLIYLLLFKRDEKRKICEIAFGIITVFFFFLPWLPAVTSKTRLFKGVRQRGIFLAGVREVLTQFNFPLDIITPPLTLGLSAVLVMVIVLMIIRQKDRGKGIIFPLFSFLLPLIVILLYPFRIHQFKVKEVIFISPFWYIILAWTVSKLKSFYKVSLLIVWIFGNTVILSIYYSPGFIKENWREAALYIESKEKEGEAIIFSPSYLGFPFDYYYRGTLPKGKIEAREALDRLRERYSSIWLIESSSYLAHPLRETRPLIESMFKEGKRFVWRGYLGDIVITEFH